MKKFIIKSLLFILPLSIFFIEGFLPLDTFTYRPWETLLYKTKSSIAFPFYPNKNIDMLSVGDLCHHTKYAIQKRENWITDKLGYRNDTFIYNPDVVIIGDSFVAGSSLEQDSTLTNLLKNKLDLKIYNIAPAEFNDFINLLKNKVIKKPKLVIFSIIEREIPAPIINEQSIYDEKYSNELLILKDKFLRFYLVKYLKARILEASGNGIQGAPDTTMFFLEGARQKYLYDQTDEVVKNITSYKKYCDSIGAKFIFFPMPNKETVYFENVPFATQPDYLFKLCSILELNGIYSINTLAVLNEFRNVNKKLLYHLDDTHWNAKGVNLLANELTKHIKLNLHK